MIRLTLIAILILTGNNVFAQNKLDISESESTTILKSNIVKLYPLNLFGTHKLSGSILSKDDFLLTDFSAIGENVVRNGYSATGFMAIDGVAIRTEFGIRINSKSGKAGIYSKSMLVNRPQQGFLNEGAFNFIMGDGLKLNIFTPVR